MKTISLLLIVAIFNLMACSSTKLITSGLDQYAEINKNIAGEECTIRFTNGLAVVGKDLYLQADSLSWTKVSYYRSAGKKYKRIDGGGVVRKSAATSEIKAIETTVSGSGIVPGILIGLGVGLLIPAIVCSGESHIPSCGVLGILTVPGGMLLGFIFGAAVGQTVIYQIEPVEQDGF